MSDPRSINTNSLQIVQIGIYGNEEFKFLIAIQVATSFDPMFHLEFLSTFLFLFFLFFLFLFFFLLVDATRFKDLYLPLDSYFRNSIDRLKSFSALLNLTLLARRVIANGSRENAPRTFLQRHKRGGNRSERAKRGLRKELSIGFRVEQEGPYRFNVSISGY